MIDLTTGLPPTATRSPSSWRRPDLPYRIVPVNIGRGEQFKPDFLTIARTTACPRSSITSPPTGARPSRCSSPAPSSLYLAEKTGRVSCRSAPYGAP